MEKDGNEEKILLPHHQQQKLCTTRLPYRQGRKLTAVKAYTITKESNHLLVFGVPSLNLRQETKTLFLRFGKLLQFNITKEHAAEVFTETYHARYERIQSARIAKKMLDTKSFYGSSLHVCYAPEMETIDETHQKLLQRQKDVLFRLRNLQKEKCSHNEVETVKIDTVVDDEVVERTLLYMGEINVIGNKVRKTKRKRVDAVQKRFKPCFVQNVDVNSQNDNKYNDNSHNDNSHNDNSHNDNSHNDNSHNDNRHNDNSYNDNIHNDNSQNGNSHNDKVHNENNKVSSNVERGITEVEIVDCTSAEQTTVSDINKALNYDKFGTEVICKVLQKPVNRIKFNINKKSLI